MSQCTLEWCRCGSPQTCTPNSSGVKHDSAKPDYSLLPLAAMEPIVRVLEHGAKKYSPDNWKKVSPATRYYSAALRHLAAHQDGDKQDKESGELHLAHAAACLIFLVWHETNTGEAGDK